MSPLIQRIAAGAVGLTLGLGLCSCAVTGVGVEGDAGVGYSGGYYEPYGYDYGGWGGAYRVGPGRCCDHRDDHRVEIPARSGTRAGMERDGLGRHPAGEGVASYGP